MNLANTIMAILTQHQLNKNTKLQMVLCKEHIAMLMPMELCKRQIILLMVMDSVLPQPIYHKHQSPQLEEAINSKGFDYRYISKIFFYKIWALKKQNKCKHIKSLLQVSSNVLSFKKSDLHIQEEFQGFERFCWSQTCLVPISIYFLTLILQQYIHI